MFWQKNYEKYKIKKNNKLYFSIEQTIVESVSNYTVFNGIGGCAFFSVFTETHEC